MAVRDPATYEEAVLLIRELEEEIESLDAFLLLRERAASDNCVRHPPADVARELRDDLPGG